MPVLKVSQGLLTLSIRVCYNIKNKRHGGQFVNCHYATLYTGTHVLALYMRVCYNIMRNAYMRVIRM